MVQADNILKFDAWPKAKKRSKIAKNVRKVFSMFVIVSIKRSKTQSSHPIYFTFVMILRAFAWLLSAAAIVTHLAGPCLAFQAQHPPSAFRNRPAFASEQLRHSQRQRVEVSQEKIAEASQILSDWDRQSNSELADQEFTGEGAEKIRARLPEAVRVLNEKANEERMVDQNIGRCMLGICASSIGEGIATLKSWVTALELPRGLLHGADKDGVPLEFSGGVYIKYNSGGVYTFADIRKSRMGFDAMWKPGDAMLEEYDGTVRGIYFQVELSDGEFRQYLLPLDLMGEL